MATDEAPPRLIYVNGVRSRIDKHAVSLSAIEEPAAPKPKPKPTKSPRPKRNSR